MFVFKGTLCLRQINISNFHCCHLILYIILNIRLWELLVSTKLMYMMKHELNCFSFCGMVDRRKAFTPYFQPGPLSEILIISDLRHVASRIWTCTESEFRLCWRKLCRSDNHEEEFVEHLSLIYKNCINSGIFPNVLKKLNIIPVYKKEDKQIIDNFIPISLLPICGKILQKIIFNSIYEFLEETDLSVNINQISNFQIIANIS